MDRREESEVLAKRWARWLSQHLRPAALIILILMIWQAATILWQIEPYLLPSPWAIIRAAFAAKGILGDHIWQTTQETLWGFGLALVVGLGLGILIDASDLVCRTVYPLLVVSQTIPIVAIAPLLAIWFGYGIWPKIIVVGLICFFPIVVNTADGLRSADPDAVSLLRTMGASQRDILRIVRIPGALPSVFSGVKIAITYSVVGAILGEWVGASRGLGIFMLRSTNSFRTDWVFASIGITSMLSLVLFGIVAAVERLALPWYRVADRQERWEELDPASSGQ